mmetsp:Transcript_47149/g.131035  ORF Transcript_47149/g.131035 Transcript_47149/m.131035 type:complete len:95 (+) Transcript_47149:1337-1621(+)
MSSGRQYHKQSGHLHAGRARRDSQSSGTHSVATTPRGKAPTTTPLSPRSLSRREGGAQHSGSVRDLRRRYTHMAIGEGAPSNFQREKKHMPLGA